MKTAMVFFMSLLAIGMAAGQLQIGTIPGNAEQISETFVTNESAKVVGAMVIGTVPEIINLNNKNVSFGTVVFADKGSKQFLHEGNLWITPDNEYTNATDVEFIVYNSTEGHAEFEVVGGMVTEATTFTILSDDGDAPLKCGCENGDWWYNTIVNVNGNWEARQL